MKIGARNTLPGVIRKIEGRACAVIEASSVMVAVD
jgi:molybdopterin-binding protein